MHKVLDNRLGGLSLPGKSVVKLTDRPDMTLDVYRGRKTTIQQHHTMEKCYFLRSITHSILCFTCFSGLANMKLLMAIIFLYCGSFSGRDSKSSSIHSSIFSVYHSCLCTQVSGQDFNLGLFL